MENPPIRSTDLGKISTPKNNCHRDTDKKAVTFPDNHFFL